MTDLIFEPERMLKITARARNLPDAWTFVMECLDEIKPEPQITITPVWLSDDGFKTAVYDVTVSGEPRDD